MSNPNSSVNDRQDQAGEQKLKILFLCTGNTCRSQMAEGLTRHLKSDIDRAVFRRRGPRQDESPRGEEHGGNRHRHLRRLPERPSKAWATSHFDYVITLCDHANESCPLFPGKTKRLHWGFEDPPKLAENAATEEEAMGHYRRVRDEIRAFVEKLPDVLND